MTQRIMSYHEKVYLLNYDSLAVTISISSERSNWENELLTQVDEKINQINEYYGKHDKNGDVLEPNLKITFHEIKNVCNIKQEVLSTNDSLNLIQIINAIPHGTLEYSSNLSGLVETSNNLAKIEWNEEENTYTIKCSSRSSNEMKLENTRNSVKAIGILGDWNVELTDSYVGWEPDFESPFLAKIKKTYEEHTQHPINIEVIHAGLETGIIGAKIPGIQMVSIGPQIKNPHSPDEKVDIKDVSIIYELIKKILQNM